MQDVHAVHAGNGRPQRTMTLWLLAALHDKVVTRFRVVELVTLVVIILMVTRPF